MQGLFASSQSVERNEFRFFANNLFTSGGYGTVTALTYAERVPKSGLDAFIKKVREDRSLSPEIFTDFTVATTTDKEEYYLILYTEPLDSTNRKALGLDLSGLYPETIAVARDTNLPTATRIFPGPILGEPTVVILLPVYKNGFPQGTIEERQENIIGVVGLVFRVKSLLADIFLQTSGATSNFVDADIFEGDKADPRAIILDTDAESEGIATDYKPAFERQTTYVIGGRSWTVRYHSTAAFNEFVSRRIGPTIVLVGGFLVTLLIAFLTYYLLEGRRRAVEIAAGMTADIETKSRNLQKVNRALITISEANQTAIQATDENKLVQEVCDILIKNAGYRMVWVGFAMDDEQKSVKPIAWAGYTEGYIEKLNASWADTERGRGPMGTAIREKRTVINPDFSKNPDFKPWYEDATKRGYKGSVVVPLFSENRVFGAINIYAAETGLFNADEVKMLEELAGDLAYSIVSIRNKAEKEKAYVSLGKTAEELSQFKFAVDNASDHIIITDPKGTITYANKGMENITGYSRQEVIGKNPRIWGGQMPKEFYAKMWHTLSVEKKPFVAEIRNKRKKGELYDTRSSISPILDDNGDIIYYVGVERDITKEKEVDRSKSEFVSLASHQLRTPLSAINWYSEMLLGGDAGKLTDKQKDYTQEIYGSSKRMSDLVGALLNVSRIEMGTFAIEPKPTNIIEIANSCIQELEPKIKGKNQLIDKQYASDIPPISVDQNLVRIVFQNLISNAVKYTPDGGKIMISMQTIGENLEIKVQDNGFGIPLRQQEKVFGKFFRADNIIPIETDGTGLGLYIVKEVLEKAGGTIRFESEENKGTTFYINSPLSGMRAKEGTRSLN